MERYLVRMKDPSTVPAASFPIHTPAVTLPPPPIAPAISPPAIAPSPYTAESLAASRPSSSLLDRLRREEAVQTRNKRQRVVEDSLRLIKQEAEDAAAAASTATTTAVESRPPPEPLMRAPDGSVQPNVTREFREKVMYVEDAESGVIPHSTRELCKWDMQPFSGVPFPIPVKYEPRENKILVLGFTCSVACALAYLNSGDCLDVQLFEQRRLTVQLARDYYGAAYCEQLVRPAPPREKLSMLYAKYAAATTTTADNNPMLAAIRDFRGDSENIIYHPRPAPPFVRVTQRVDEEIIRKERDELHRQRLDLMNATPQPLACTPRGMQEQRKYVLARQTGQQARKSRGVINTLLNIQYKSLHDDADGDDESGGGGDDD